MKSLKEGSLTSNLVTVKVIATRETEKANLSFRSMRNHIIENNKLLKMFGYNENKGSHTYYVYIITNAYRSTYYIGVTNNLSIRLQQHQNNIKYKRQTFAAKYNLKHLVFYEKFSWVQNAIAREKELKGWRREKKLNLIKAFNENFEFLEDQFLKDKE